LRPRIGDSVLIVEPPNRVSRLTTEGVVDQVLTKSVTHPRGIKVRLTTGQVGFVRMVLNRIKIR